MTPEEIQRRIREIFRAEATELMSELEAGLLELEQSPGDAAAIGRVFRALHTLKGSGATSGFAELSQFVHRVEDVFFAAREGRLQVTSAMIDSSLRIADAVQRYLAAAPEAAAAVLLDAQPLLDKLLSLLPSEGANPGSAPAAPPPPPPAERVFAIRFTPQGHLFQTGADPGVQLDDLRALGRCTIRAAAEALPPLGELDPERSYLGWEIRLTTASTEAHVREVFAFVEDDCALEVRELPPVEGTVGWSITFTTDAALASTPGVVETLLLDLAKLGRPQVELAPPKENERHLPGPWRIALETPAETPADDILDAFIFMPGVQPAITKASPPSAGPSPAPTAAVAATTPAGAPAPASSAPAATPETPAAQTRHNAVGESLRVSAERLDRLVNMVGELVILRSQVSNACASMRDVPPALQSASEGLERLTKELRDVVLEVRMMPIGETFAKFKRLCRDLARELGKEVELQIEGADTELDKTVLEQLKDPLVHLVRNCLDHGLERPDDRERAGKPRHGRLTLRAEQSGDRVLVTVADDGRGLDTARIRAKAVARGLLAPEANPTESEIHQLVFLPGFSTAETVSQVSGRGVGLDVVKRQLDHLRGSVEMQSRPGGGTLVRLSVPLTLAIIEGLLVSIDGDRYVLPLGQAEEAIELSRRTRELHGGRNMVELRGDLVPYLRLREVFDYETTAPEVERVVIVTCAGKRVGLVVDEVLGNHQTVLKSLGWMSRHVKVFSGATVLGDGRIGLICDVAALVTHAVEKRGPGSALEL